MKSVLIIDNFDSFTFNLMEIFKQAGCHVDVVRNDVLLSDLDFSKYDLLALSPGPSIPSKAGHLMQIIDMAVGTLPIIGVCLGHQALIEYFGGSLKFIVTVHGKRSEIICDQSLEYAGLPVAITVGRYHSLVGDRIPDVLEVVSHTTEGLVMGVRHKSLPIFGIQFHPESFLTSESGVGCLLYTSPSPRD